ncbi:hypothetical protein Cgig2_015447 [Carnegiea gigantea]|uniref:Uncharacterized protein n=1 Tax=Carnegiea gigantea TaxID=171969 RepID=A0A9Q1Q9N7_9CARY|nr:hypothetical protein Cgig2_015447 [Carnegiea gigantea]
MGPRIKVSGGRERSLESLCEDKVNEEEENEESSKKDEPESSSTQEPSGVETSSVKFGNFRKWVISSDNLVKGLSEIVSILGREIRAASSNINRAIGFDAELSEKRSKLNQELANLDLITMERDQSARKIASEHTPNDIETEAAFELHPIVNDMDKSPHQPKLHMEVNEEEENEESSKKDEPESSSTQEPSGVETSSVKFGNFRKWVISSDNLVQGLSEIVSILGREIRAASSNINRAIGFDAELSEKRSKLNQELANLDLITMERDQSARKIAYEHTPNDIETEAAFELHPIVNDMDKSPHQPKLHMEVGEMLGD